MTRTQRTYVVAAAVAAIVTAANASQGAYFSQSWGWVALAFLVPTTVLLIVDRVDVPGRLRVAFAALMVALAVWIGLSAVWSISTPASIREVERALVTSRSRWRVALVLRRGDGPAVLAGVVHRDRARRLGYGLATRLVPDHFGSPDDAVQRVSALEAARVLELLRAPCRDGRDPRASASSRTVGAAGMLAVAAAIAVPVLVTALVLHILARLVAALSLGFAAIALDPRRCVSFGRCSLSLQRRPSLHRVASRQDALTTENRRRRCCAPRRTPTCLVAGRARRRVRCARLAGPRGPRGSLSRRAAGRRVSMARWRSVPWLSSRSRSSRPVVPPTRSSSFAIASRRSRRQLDLI